MREQIIDEIEGIGESVIPEMAWQSIRPQTVIQAIVESEEFAELIEESPFSWEEGEKLAAEAVNRPYLTHYMADEAAAGAEYDAFRSDPHKYYGVSPADFVSS